MIWFQLIPSHPGGKVSTEPVPLLLCMKSKEVCSISFHLFCKENGYQNATVNNAIEAVLKYTNVKVD